MAKTYHIWTLNRATDLCDSRMNDVVDALRGGFWSRIFGRGKDILCEPGHRDNATPAHQLMSEQTDFDEYFVPIPVKCLGNRIFRQDALDDDAVRMLRGIASNYSYFIDERHATYQSFWDPDAHLPINDILGQVFGKVRMLTSPVGTGYYEILEQTSENNILIAYSQGGLVARYLAFLDEYIFKKNIITAIITISSPNYGSPLANPENANDIATGLRDVLLTLLSFYQTDFENLYKQTALNYRTLYETILAAYKDADKSDHETKELLKSAIKWFSGLEKNENSAFYDLSISNYDHEFSVLSLVNAYPLQRIYQGSIISANARLQDLLYSQLGWFGDLALKYTTNIKMWGNSIWDNISVASDIYQKKIMTEHLASDETDPIKLHFADAYYVGGLLPKGVPAQIEPFAHDFIIPSVCQMLPETERLLGQYVNVKANHNSGRSDKEDAGKENIRLLIKLLNQLKAYL
jgi:hypothetical protein